MSSLRYDILLAHLLFGMMLLTSAIAVAHALGDALLGGRNISPRLRSAARAMLATTLVAAVLLAFTSVRVEGGALALTAGRGVLGDSPAVFLPRSEVLRKAEGPPEGTGLDETWTSFEPRAAELALPLAPWMRLALVEATSADDGCATWATMLAREAGTTLAAQTNGAHAIVACAAGLSDATRVAALREQTEKGAGLIVVGGVPDAAANGAAAVLGGLRFRSLVEAGEPANVAFGGAGLVPGAPLQGLVLGFGERWQAEAGNVAVGSGPARPVSVVHAPLPLWPESTALWLGDGRRAWTSLPPVLYGKLAALVGSRWRLVARSMLAHALGLPSAALPFARAGREAPRLAFTVPAGGAPQPAAAQLDLGDGDRGVALGRAHAIGADVLISARRWTHLGPWLAARVKSGEALAAAASAEALTRPTVLVVPAPADHASRTLAESLGLPTATVGAVQTPPEEVQAFSAWQRARAALAASFTSPTEGALELVLENRGTTAVEAFQVLFDARSWRPQGEGANWRAVDGAIAVAILAAGERVAVPFTKGAP